VVPPVFGMWTIAIWLLFAGPALSGIDFLPLALIDGHNAIIGNPAAPVSVARSAWHALVADVLWVPLDA